MPPGALVTTCATMRIVPLRPVRPSGDVRRTVAVGSAAAIVVNIMAAIAMRIERDAITVRAIAFTADVRIRLRQRNNCHTLPARALTSGAWVGQDIPRAIP